jgi:hypothetical protein
MAENVYSALVNEIGAGEKMIFGAEKLAGTAFSVVKDAKLLLRALEGLNKGTIMTIGVALKLEHLFKRIELTKDKSANLGIFFSKCANRYGLNELDTGELKEILELGEKHKKSGFEFSRWGNAIMLDDALGATKVDSEKLIKLACAGKKLAESVKTELERIFQKGI